jgi:KDO2-lipid IV(A) lauroyltransferase
VARQIIQYNLKNYFDLFRAHRMTASQFDQEVEVRGLEYVREAEKSGKGIIAFSGHLGSFSFVPQVATRVKVHFNLAVEILEPPRLFEFVRKLREVDGQFKLIGVGGPEARNLFRALRRNEMVCLAIDRDVTGGGVAQEFFGASTILPTGAADLALRTGACVMPIHAYRMPNNSKCIIQFYPAFELESTGNRQADVLKGNAVLLQRVEEMIRTTPEQWVVLQPIWTDCA